MLIAGGEREEKKFDRSTFLQYLLRKSPRSGDEKIQPSPDGSTTIAVWGAVSRSENSAGRRAGPARGQSNLEYFY